MTPKILVIDDDTSFCIMLKTFLQKKSFEVTNAFTAMEASDLIRSSTFDVVLTDIRLPDSDGIAILELVKQVSPKTQIILMTGYTEIKAAVNAMKLGAFDYVGKPINPDEILHTIQQSLRKSAEKDAKVTTDKPSQKAVSANQVVSFVKGISNHSNKLHEYISLVAPTNMSVLIMGDSGTGKEYIAHSIHAQSKRANKPFVAVDCGAIPKDLASSEFFGHIKGSFTGAVNDKTGHFEAANGGTIFLDEVGNLSYEVQVQLLRALQERKVKPVGSNTETKVDIRVIAATNEDLAEAVRNGDFREDLFHRLNEFSIQAPRLSERKNDIMIFAHHFLAEANHDLEREVVGFDQDVTELFLNYDWPGNLREMKNTIKRSVLLTRAGLIETSVLPHEMLNPAASEESAALYKEDEETAIRKALDQTNFNKSKAARLLDIDRKTLYNKLKLYNIDL
ncbi:sigma-54 dependent transcriptional regulator [Flavobacterium sp.]|uniref:sigma-54-dependent transcriptional regulator n=1 Tax=Flavobacterium sp. TaxID=239 RepID=UPI001224E29D|nr:sigma-54 dependent transcriptional regulator [Flavobacterium sp.]RZJ70272.1 MAG: sigma-54-dependent Fis family transcriptional regulator [Flavobacterium sp.]